jgi:hypothetical protein
MSKCTSAAWGSRQGGPSLQLEGALCPLAGSVGPIVGRRVVERHRAALDLAGILLHCSLICRPLAKWKLDLSNTKAR